MLILILLSLNFIIFVIAVYSNTNPFDYYDPKRYKFVSIWLAKKYLKYHNETNVYLSREEIINYGIRFANCYECIIDNKCIHCGCDAEGRFNNITDECSLGKWGIFLDKKEIDDIFNNPDFKFSINIIEEENES